MPELYELQAQRKNLLEQAHQISDRAKNENRDLTAEERTNYNKYFDDAAALKTKIDQEIRERKVARELAALDAVATRPERRGSDGPDALSLLGQTKELRRLWVGDVYHQRRYREGHPRAGYLLEHGLIRTRSRSSMSSKRAFARLVTMTPG
jgi:hypothetical protein